MLIKTEERTLEATGIQQQAVFKIKPDAMMFKKLSKDIYTNPLQAVVRELLDNAIDAVAKDLSKVTLRLPNEFEPTLSIEDQGRGMTHEFIIDRYSTYGESTKSGSNESIGGFGFGSKTPFALTESFSIQAFDSEGLRTYTCFKDEQGFPNIALVFKGPKPKGSPETGITVKVPIKKDKIRDLTEYVKLLYVTKACYFNKRFNIVGLDIGQMNLLDEHIKSEIRYVDSQTGLSVSMFPTSYAKGNFILMGGTPYPYSLVSSYYKTSDYWVHYPVGAFEVTLPRETIEKDSLEQGKPNLIRTVERAKMYLLDLRKKYFADKLKGMSSYEKLKFLADNQVKNYDKDTDAIINLAENYTTVNNYLYRNDSVRNLTNRISFEQSLYNTSHPDSLCFIYNDTPLRTETVQKKIKDYRAKGRLPSLASFKNIGYSATPIDAAVLEWSLTSIFKASDLFVEIAGDKTKAQKLLLEYKNEALIRFKVYEKGYLTALTAAEYKGFLANNSKCYYFSLDKNVASDVSTAPLKDVFKSLKGLDTELNTTGILFVPKGKEKFLDASKCIDIVKEFKDVNSDLHKKFVKRVFMARRSTSHKEYSFYDEYNSSLCKNLFPNLWSKASNLMEHAYCDFKDMLFLSKIEETSLYKEFLDKDLELKEAYVKERDLLVSKYPLFFLKDKKWNNSLSYQSVRHLMFYINAVDSSASKALSL